MKENRLEILRDRMTGAEERGLFATPVMHADLTALLDVAKAVDSGAFQTALLAVRPLVEEA